MPKSKVDHEARAAIIAAFDFLVEQPPAGDKWQEYREARDAAYAAVKELRSEASAGEARPSGVRSLPARVRTLLAE